MKHATYDERVALELGVRDYRPRQADDILIIPTKDGILDLQPTSVLRWYVKKTMFRKTPPPRLQQLWRDRETQAPFWRDVPIEAE